MLYIFQNHTCSYFSKLTLLTALLLISTLLASCQVVDSQNLQQPTPISTPTFQPEIPLWEKPVGDKNILPTPLYFVSTKTDEAGISCSQSHIVKIERDGHTRTMITPCNIDGGINGFDVSPATSDIVFIAQGSMWIIDGKSEKPRLLIVSSPNPEYPDPQTFDMRNPQWSPDGTKIAYEDGGIRILDVTTGDILNVTDNICTAKSDDQLFEINPCLYSGAYRILQWSPDNKSLHILKDEEDSRAQFLHTFDSNKSVSSSYVGVYPSPFSNSPFTTDFQEGIQSQVTDAWGWRWYKDDKYAAFRKESGRPISNGLEYIGYVGKQYIGVIEIQTEKIYLLAEENISSIPSFEEVWEANHLVWGLP